MFKRAFTLIEILVVLAIIAIVAAILFPVFARAKENSKKVSCLSNARQIGMASALYTTDYDGFYPQTRKTSVLPEIEDIAGWIDEPNYGSVYVLIFPYTGAGKITADDLSGQKLFVCPADPDPFGKGCFVINPDAPAVTSYVTNAFFVFGLNESAVERPTDTIMDAERRSQSNGVAVEFCDDVYHPWFSSDNLFAPENEMSPTLGAVATTRHSDLSNFVFADGHTKGLPWSQTYSVGGVNLHTIR